MGNRGKNKETRDPANLGSILIVLLLVSSLLVNLIEPPHFRHGRLIEGTRFREAANARFSLSAAHRRYGAIEHRSLAGTRRERVGTNVGRIQHTTAGASVGGGHVQVDVVADLPGGLL